MLGDDGAVERSSSVRLAFLLNEVLVKLICNQDEICAGELDACVVLPSSALLTGTLRTQDRNAAGDQVAESKSGRRCFVILIACRPRRHA